MNTARLPRVIMDRIFRPIRMSHLAISALLLMAPAASIGSCSAPTPTPPTTTVPTTAPASALKVSGNRFVDGSGKVVQLRGVNRPGTEYRCVQNIPYGFITDDNGTDGLSAAYATKLVAAMRSWSEPGQPAAINTVRIPLNEACWLGINGANPAYSGANYQHFIRTIVDALTAAGMYTVLDLHWSAPGGTLPTQQDVGPNADHSIQFWREVATQFQSTPSVAFDLFNEPHLWCYTSECSNNYALAAKTAWTCYRDGCAYGYRPDDHITGRTSGTVQIAGTQQLVDAIRGTGAHNVILIGGLGYANALDNWVKFKPNDPDAQIAASVHSYPNSGATVNTQSYLDSMLGTGGLSSSYPVFVGEFGEFLCGSSTTGFTQKTMDWADSHGYSYTAWGWDQGEGCSGPTLVSTNSGTPTAFGSIVQEHLQERAG